MQSRSSIECALILFICISVLLTENLIFIGSKAGR